MRTLYFTLVIGICLLSAGTLVQADVPQDMVLVDAGEFTFRVEYRWVEGLSLDTLMMDERGTRYQFAEKGYVNAFYIDKTEVTNAQFKAFLDATNYQPKFGENFLKHWRNGAYPAKKADHPVVWITIDDAKAYARWVGKRLPTEIEWQKAAQGTDGRDWPWGNVYDPAKANMDSKDTQPVGSYPAGASPYGCLDMAGNVWEWTDSVESDGYHYFSWIRGGSYFFAQGSRWYMQGGPTPNYQRAKFWMMTPALNRSSSIGFRCVKDVL